MIAIITKLILSMEVGESSDMIEYDTINGF